MKKKKTCILSFGTCLPCCFRGRAILRLQGYLAHKNPPPPKLGPPYEHRHGPTVWSYGVAVCYKRGTPVCYMRVIPLQHFGIASEDRIGTVRTVSRFTLGAIEPR